MDDETPAGARKRGGDGELEAMSGGTLLYHKLKQDGFHSKGLCVCVCVFVFFYASFCKNQLESGDIFAGGQSNKSLFFSNLVS